MARPTAARLERLCGEHTQHCQVGIGGMPPVPGVTNTCCSLGVALHPSGPPMDSRSHFLSQDKTPPPPGRTALGTCHAQPSSARARPRACATGVGAGAGGDRAGLRRRPAAAAAVRAGQQSRPQPALRRRHTLQASRPRKPLSSLPDGMGCAAAVVVRGRGRAHVRTPRGSTDNTGPKTTTQQKTKHTKSSLTLQDVHHRVFSSRE